MAPEPAAQNEALEISPLLDREVRALEQSPLHKSFSQAVRRLGGERIGSRRIENLSTQMREMDTGDSTRFLMAAARMALSGETEGLRTLFSALNVRRTGVEVLKHLQRMSSIERTSLLLHAGAWHEPKGSDSENPAFAIMDVLKEAAARGVLVGELQHWPRSATSARETLNILRHWMAWMTLKLSARQEIPQKAMDLIAQICLLEISLAERRVSRLAESIDPYDIRAMARLMPLFSQYDQAIESWKLVISEIHTYVPFSKMVMTLEAVITDTEMSKIEKTLLGDPGGRVVGCLLQALRRNPVLDQELLCLVSVLYQTVNLRAIMHPKNNEPIDLISTCVAAIEGYRAGELPPLLLQPDEMESMWPTLKSWGIWKKTDRGLIYEFSESRSLDFINPDGTPVLDPIPGFHNAQERSLENLMLTQLHNDAFILGLLDNPAAIQRPTIVSTLAMMSRSVRVLSKIAHDRTLHTGPNKEDVPRLLLQNPARIPLGTLRRFVHVRFVSKTDLRKMGHSNSDVRSEVRREVQQYLESLKA